VRRDESEARRRGDGHRHGPWRLCPQSKLQCLHRWDAYYPHSKFYPERESRPRHHTITYTCMNTYRGISVFLCCFAIKGIVRLEHVCGNESPWSCQTKMHDNLFPCEPLWVSDGKKKFYALLPLDKGFYGIRPDSPIKNKVSRHDPCAVTFCLCFFVSLVLSSFLSRCHLVVRLTPLTNRAERERQRKTNESVSRQTKAFQVQLLRQRKRFKTTKAFQDKRKRFKCSY